MKLRSEEDGSKGNGAGARPDHPEVELDPGSVSWCSLGSVALKRSSEVHVSWAPEELPFEVGSA